MSVAALLKPYLDATNASRLLDAMATCSTVRAREVLAAWFPRPDVPTSVRKLPQPRSAPPAMPSAPARQPQTEMAPAAEASPPSAPHPTPALALPAALALTGAPLPIERRPPAPARIEPLAPGRYKVQLTASAELKAKLELARDLLRHTIPSGDYAALIERALDLLIADVKKRRFGASSRPRTGLGVAAIAESDAVMASAGRPANAPTAATSATPAVSGVAASALTASQIADAAASEAAGVEHGVTDSPDARAHGAISRAMRRSVAERDDLCCSWVSEDGRRCGARAWLEYDHRWPRGKGGPTSAEYLRLLCRAHNHLEAERVYGRGTLDRAIQRARTRDAPGDPRSNDPDGPAPGTFDPAAS